MVVGTQALRDPDWFGRMAETYPGRLILGLDARDGRVATEGWLDVSSIQALTFARQFESLPLAGIIYTDIARDGMLEGPNLEAIAALAGSVQDPGDRLGRSRRAARPGAAGGAARSRGASWAAPCMRAGSR